MAGFEPRSQPYSSRVRCMVDVRTACCRTWMADAPQPYVLPVTSLNESRMLRALGLPEIEQNQILGLRMRRGAMSSALSGSLWLTEQQLSSRAIVRLAGNPPPQVGKLQRLASKRLLRPFPLGLRMSGKNMSPLPCWLSGAQGVALNMSNNDLSIQLHFALFHGSEGYVLKPSAMLSALASDKADEYWPPPTEVLHVATIAVLSLHNLPKSGERRPCYNGRRGACHKFVPNLSGTAVAPTNVDPSSPQISLSLHPIGGAPSSLLSLFCLSLRAPALSHCVRMCGRLLCN